MVPEKKSPIHYHHVKSHIGYPLSEFADDLAKLGARQFYSANAPLHLFPEWYDLDSAAAEWSWLVDLNPEQKAALGLPSIQGNFIPFPPEIQPSREHLTSLIQDSLPPPTMQGARFIKLTIGTLKVGGLKNFQEKAQSSKKPGTEKQDSWKAGQAPLLAERFHQAKLHIVALQDTHARDSGQSTVGHYTRVIPESPGPFSRLELWVNTHLPWDPSDQEAKVKPKDIVVWAQGDRYAIV